MTAALAELDPDAADDLGNRRGVVLGVARIFALRRIDDVDVLADLEAPLLDRAGDHFVRRARIGRALQRDQLALAQVRRDRSHGGFDEAEVGLSILIQGCWHANDQRIALGCSAEVAGGNKASLADLGDLAVGNVLDRALGAVQFIDTLLGDMGAIWMNRRDAEANPGPAKYAASLLGKCAEELRLPLVPLASSCEPTVTAALAAAGIRI